jgi:hypothetical protein
MSITNLEGTGEILLYPSGLDLIQAAGRRMLDTISLFNRGG